MAASSDASLIERKSYAIVCGAKRQAEDSFRGERAPGQERGRALAYGRELRRSSCNDYGIGVTVSLNGSCTVATGLRSQSRRER